MQLERPWFCCCTYRLTGGTKDYCCAAWCYKAECQKSGQSCGKTVICAFNGSTVLEAQCYNNLCRTDVIP